MGDTPPPPPPPEDVVDSGDEEEEQEADENAGGGSTQNQGSLQQQAGQPAQQQSENTPAAVNAGPTVAQAVAVAAPAQTGSTKKSPSDFLKTVLGRPVVVKLNSGIDYRGELVCNFFRLRYRTAQPGRTAQ